MLLLFLISSLIGVSVGGSLFDRNLNEPDCQAANDGVQWAACGSYGRCQGGQYTQVDCSNGTVYNNDSQQCTPPGIAPFPCNLPPKDSVCADPRFAQTHGHRLPLMDQDPSQNRRPPCTVYYTCTFGRFLPYQWCPPGTVYDEENQRCDNPADVPPPCGTGPSRNNNGQGWLEQNQLGQNNFGFFQNRQGQSGNNRNQNQFGGQNRNLYGAQTQSPFGSQNRNPFGSQTQSSFGSQNQNSIYGSGQGGQNGYGGSGSSNSQGTGYGSSGGNYLTRF